MKNFPSHPQNKKKTSVSYGRERMANAKMKEEHQIVDQVCAAQSSVEAADELVRRYLPFIRSETAKFLGRPPIEGQDDALSIAMFAFYEAAMAYRRERGAFIPFAATAIRNRLIDAVRRDSRQTRYISLDTTDAEEEHILPLLERLDAGEDPIEDFSQRQATQEEILEFRRTLEGYGLTLSKVADSCPRQERSMEVCHAALARAKADPTLLVELERTKKLPMKGLSGGSRATRKTLERHRPYMMAILLAYTNGFEIIRGHLCQISDGKGGRKQ